MIDTFAARTASDGVAAYRLARHVIGATPSGRVLVASARTHSLQKAYLRLGFTRGEQLRVFMER